MIGTETLSDRVRNVARRVGRLRPDWRAPERYFAERDELERSLASIARRIEREHG